MLWYPMCTYILVAETLQYTTCSANTLLRIHRKNTVVFWLVNLFTVLFTVLYNLLFSQHSELLKAATQPRCKMVFSWKDDHYQMLHLLT